MPAAEKRRYGWIPDLPDDRDKLFQVPELPSGLPERTDLRSNCPEPYNQAHLGSCTANAIAAAIEFAQRRQGLPQFTPSRLFIYYNEREMEHSTKRDAGARIRDGIKSVNRLGVCDEQLWPYITTRFAVKPPEDCYTAAKLHKTLAYERIAQDLTALRVFLAGGFPVVFGFAVYKSFETPHVRQTGDVSMPLKRERALGGHAVLAVGYDDLTQRFTVLNSWGAHWGRKGYFTLPYEYVANERLAHDFWSIQLTL